MRGESLTGGGPSQGGSVDVTGGTHGLAVQEQQLTHLASTLGAAGVDSVAAAAALHRYLLDPEITLSALFDPAGGAAFESALVAALDGPFGLTWAAARCGLADLGLRAAVAAYNGVEYEIARQTNVLELPLALAYFAEQKFTTHSTSLALQHTITRYPGLADDLIDDLGLVGPIRAAAAAGGSLDGHSEVIDTGTDHSGADARPPRSLSDLVAALGQRDDAADARHGAIDVRILTRADGTRAVIVDITGTKSWTPLPSPDITSLITNDRALVGDRTSYETGVLKALTKAGVTPADDVLLIGHSEGGMVAVNTARDAVRDGRFNVTHVITAGSPIGLTVGSVPRSVKVLALENTSDLVPHLDGAANPASANVTTVSGRYGNGTVGDDHGIAHGYGPLATATQASTDPSIRDYLGGLSRYLDADHSSTTTYQIVRKY